MKVIRDIPNLELIKMDTRFMLKDNCRIFLCSKDIGNNVKTINDIYRLDKNIKGYFIDYLYRVQIFNKQFNRKLKTDKIYNQITSRTNITKCLRNIDMYGATNTYVDMYFFNKAFFTGAKNINNLKTLSEVSTDYLSEFYNQLPDSKIGYSDFMLQNLSEAFTGKKVCTEYMNLFNMILNSYSVGGEPLQETEPNTNSEQVQVTQKVGSYENYMIINLEDWGVNFRMPSAYKVNNVACPLSVILIQLLNNLEEFKKIDNITFVIRGGGYTIVVRPQECDDKSYPVLKTLLRMMQTRVDSTSNSSTLKVTNKPIAVKETEINDDVENAISSITKNIQDKFDDVLFYSFNGETSKGKDIVDQIEKTAEKINSEDKSLSDDELKNDTVKELEENKEFMQSLEKIKMQSITGTVSSANNRRNEILQQEQLKIKVNKSGKTLEQILKEADDQKLKPKKIASKTANKDMRELRLANFNDTYGNELLDKDTLAIINFFSTLRYKVYVRDIKKEDTSDAFDKKYTYTISLETEKRHRYTMKFDFPKFIDNTYLFVGGNKKKIINQFVLKPVEKTGPDTVQLCSNYNKIFLVRNGTRLSDKLEKIKKVLSSNNGVNTRSKIYFIVGDSRIPNSTFKTTLEYDDFSSYYLKLHVNSSKDKYAIYFNQDLLRNEFTRQKIKFDTDDTKHIPIGLKNGKDVIYLNNDKNIIEGSGESLSDFIIRISTEAIPEFKNTVLSTSVGKKFICTNATIMKKHIPIVFILAFMEGLFKVLEKAGVDYELTDKRPKASVDDKVLQFSDGFIWCKNTTIAQDLILNGFAQIPTRSYSLADMNNKETYLDIADTVFGNRMLLNAFENFYDLFIDPITKTVLEQLNLPTDFVSLVIYGNKLLEDNQFKNETSLYHYRLRRNELVNGHLYKTLSTAYERHRGSITSKNPAPFTVPQDQLMKDLFTSPSTEDNSDINPIAEAEGCRNVSFRGLSGMNEARAYTKEKRSYDNTMRGIVAMSTTPSGSVGIVRQLAMDANILSARGFMDVSDDINDESRLNSANSFCPAELLTTTCAQRDDAPRVAMTTTQAKHIIPADNYHRLIFNNGADDVLAHTLPNGGFVFKAKQDGKVIKIDEDNHLVTIQYNDKSHDIIDIGEVIMKNGGGGIYLSSQLKHKLKVGQKFNQGDVLAYNKDFFDNYNDGEVSLKAGVLSKIAIISGYFNYEDSGLITNKLADSMTSRYITKKDIVLGKNSNVIDIVNIGDMVNVGDPLLIFDESYEDEGLNKLLDNLSADTKEIFDKTSKIPVKSSYSGRVADIKVYYTVEKSELSKTMQKAIGKINKFKMEKEKAIKKFVDNPNSLDIVVDPTEKVEAKYNKVKGVDVGEGVYFEFYIEQETRMGVGDKFTFFTALKAVTGEVVPLGLEPFTASRPHEEISAFLSPISILARMTGSIFINMWINLLAIEAKRSALEMYFEDEFPDLTTAA